MSSIGFADYQKGTRTVSTLRLPRRLGTPTDGPRTDFLAKPFPPGTLATKVREVLG